MGAPVFRLAPGECYFTFFVGTRADAPGRFCSVGTPRCVQASANRSMRGMWEDSALTSNATAVRTRSQKPSATSPIRISPNTLQRMTAVFKLLADQSRLKIVLALAEDEELHVSALCEMLGQSQPAVSHHLTLMRMVGLVGYRRDGKHNYYHLASAHVRDLLEQFFADSGNGHKAIQFDDFALTFKRK